MLTLFPFGDKALEAAVTDTLRTIGLEAARLRFQVLSRLGDLSECIHDIAGCSPPALQFVECLDECVDEARKHADRIIAAKGRAKGTLQPLFEAARDGSARHGSSPSVGSPEPSSALGVVGASEPTEGEPPSEASLCEEAAALVSKALDILARAWDEAAPLWEQGPEVQRLFGGSILWAEARLWAASTILDRLTNDGKGEDQ